MGFAISWFAVPEEHAASFFERLGLLATGETSEWADFKICSAASDKGWRILWYNAHECPFLNEHTCRGISLHHHDILACHVEEHVMVASVTLWSQGQVMWHLFHDGSGGAKGLEVTGTPPEEFQKIRDRCETLQAEAGGARANVDYLFEIPLEVALSVAGFKHDQDPVHIVDSLFHEMTRAGTPETIPSSVETSNPKKSGFFKRWFGKR